MLSESLLFKKIVKIHFSEHNRRFNSMPPYAQELAILLMFVAAFDILLCVEVILHDYTINLVTALYIDV